RAVTSTSTNSTKLTFAEKLVWLIFVAACFQLTFLVPYWVVVPGERTNVFSGIVCAVALVSTLLLTKNRWARLSRGEILVSLGLVILATASSLTSETPWSSSLRGFVLVASGLGGFWCSRIILKNIGAQKFFAYICAGLLACVLVLSCWDFFTERSVFDFLYSNPHPLVSMIFLLSFAPLSLVAMRKPFITACIGVPLLVFAYAVLYLCGSRIVSGVIISSLLMFIVAVLAPVKSYRTVTLMAVLLLMASCSTSNYIEHVSKKSFSNIGYQEGRMELYPFSWHIAKHHPFLGIGLRSPRVKYLQDYQIWHPALKPQDFVTIVKQDITSENILLCFMVDLGFPFLILYIFALVVLFSRLVRTGFGAVQGTFFHPLALLLPLAGSFFHSLTTDTLLYPQICWYFFILLGLIPFQAKQEVQPTENLKLTWARPAGAVGIVILGCFIGTHPALAPENLESGDVVQSYLSKIPLISVLMMPKAAQSSAHVNTAPAKTVLTRAEPGKSPAKQAVVPRVIEPPAPGSLTINVKNYKGITQKWALLVILDNSETMAIQTDNWSPNRAAAAADFVHRLEAEMPRGSELAIRYFSNEVPLKRKRRNLPLRVSRLLDNWADAPVLGLTQRLGQIDSGGRNSPCNAVIRALRNDFAAAGNRVPRIMIMTDGQTECSGIDMSREVKLVKMKESPEIDVVALGMPSFKQKSYMKLAENSGGTFLKINGSADLDSSVRSYAQVLNALRQEPVEVVGKEKTYTTPPGQKLDLAPGEYTIVVPSSVKPDSAGKLTRQLKINPGEDREVELSVDK
ncbi:MAG: O-antigen ligase family protein, partial [Desulfomonilaceae bacterium]